MFALNNYEMKLKQRKMLKTRENVEFQLVICRYRLIFYYRKKSIATESRNESRWVEKSRLPYSFSYKLLLWKRFIWLFLSTFTPTQTNFSFLFIEEVIDMIGVIASRLNCDSWKKRSNGRLIKWKSKNIDIDWSFIQKWISYSVDAVMFYRIFHEITILL